MIGLDTNVLVRYLTGDDERQFRTARRFLEEVETAGNTVRVDHVVLAELSWVLQISYRFDRATLVAQEDGARLRFDIRLQGDRATVFFAH